MFTPTEQRMMDVLGDGLPHTAKELHACLMDELGPVRNITTHLSNIRKKLARHGQGVAMMENGNARTVYRLVRFLASATDGKK